MFKLVIDALIGGTVDKLLKGNNAMTGVILVLMCYGVWLGYTNHQDIATVSAKLDHIQAAFHYKFNIDPEQPFRGGGGGNDGGYPLNNGNNHGNDSGTAYQHRDALLANNEEKVLNKNKQN